jgi:hypothetical protein
MGGNCRAMIRLYPPSHCATSVRPAAVATQMSSSGQIVGKQAHAISHPHASTETIGRVHGPLWTSVAQSSGRSGWVARRSMVTRCRIVAASRPRRRADRLGPRCVAWRPRPRGGRVPAAAGGRRATHAATGRTTTPSHRGRPALWGGGRRAAGAGEDVGRHPPHPVRPAGRGQRVDRRFDHDVPHPGQNLRYHPAPAQPAGDPRVQDRVQQRFDAVPHAVQARAARPSRGRPGANQNGVPAVPVGVDQYRRAARWPQVVQVRRGEELLKSG